MLAESLPPGADPFPIPPLLEAFPLPGTDILPPLLLSQEPSSPAKTAGLLLGTVFVVSGEAGELVEEAGESVEDAGESVEDAGALVEDTGEEVVVAAGVV